MRRKDREVTDILEIEKILGMTKTCHVAMVDEGKPYVIPLSFGYNIEGDTLILYFHSAKQGKKMNILQKNKEVCFEMCNEGEPLFEEIPCNCGYYFSSLVGFGEVIFIEDMKEKGMALSKMFEHQANKKVIFDEKQANSVCVYKIVSKNFTGKRKEKPQN